MSSIGPMPEADPALDAEAIRSRLREGGPALVALSGGVDSGAMAALAFDALGAQATAVTLVGPAVAAEEVARARAVAEAIGIRHEILTVDPLESDDYRRNPANRCYFCRRTETLELRRWGESHGIRQYLDGVHADDLSDERPGLRAMAEAGFAHPLADAGWRKTDVRAFARSRGLPNWDAPSDACLASRVTHGVPIDQGLLRRVELGEAAVRALGFVRVRVRTDGRAARIEVDPPEVARLRSPAVAASVLRALELLGFSAVELDPNGYRPRPGA